MKTTVVISALNQFDLLRENLSTLTKDADTSKFDILVVDNGSDEPFTCDIPNVKVIRFEEPFGSYPIFKIGLENSDSDVLAFIHSDFFLWDKKWVEKVEQAFNDNAKLGLVGMIGASGWGSNGGRIGTMGSFQGMELRKYYDANEEWPEGKAFCWTGSPASAHGEDVTGQLRKACQLDGCSMIFRRSCLESLPLDTWNIPHHWYDRLLCAWCIERDWEIGVIGIPCDHFSGQTVNGSKTYDKMAKEWCANNLGITEPSQWLDKHREWVNNPTNPDCGICELINWDQVLYHEGQLRFMKEFRDIKHLIPR